MRGSPGMEAVNCGFQVQGQGSAGRDMLTSMMRTNTTSFLLRLALLALWVLAGSALAQAPAQAQARFDFRATPGHLSKDVRPSHYRLQLDLDPQLDTFKGTASITLRVLRSTPEIELHAHELEADSVRLVRSGQARAMRVSPIAASQTWRLVPADAGTIQPGQYRLEIAYRGVVHRSGEGLYRAEYGSAGQPRPMLATQLESIFARTLFPGFDEPAFRAVFEIAVRAPALYEVLSNMPRKAGALGRSGTDFAVLHQFAPTPPMPSYLVSVAVGEFDALEGRAAGVPLRVLTVPGKRELARYALDASQRLLPFYTRYFNQPYTLPRLDQLAVPSTRWGAMEDWGLISYAENNLLVDPQRSSPHTQRKVFEIVAHEIAHQWFGNLVTAASWSEIWLNEAFATWISGKATDDLNPDWYLPLQRRADLDRTMQRDAGAATRAIRSGPVDEARVFDVFDNITYAKGGAVLSMLEEWLGPETFQRGLAAYIAQRKFSNATAGDLWFHVGAAAGRDVAGVAASWTDQEGFPLLQVRVECESGMTLLHIAQRRFGLDPGAADSGQRWQIPVRVARGARFDTVLQTQLQQTHRLTGCRTEPLLVNAGGAGFYRVAYEPTHLAALQRAFADLSAPDQVTLLSDSFALAQAGRANLQDSFALLAQLPRIRGPGRAMLATQAGDALLLLDTALAGSSAQAVLRAAGSALLAPELARLGWLPRAGDDAQALALRATLIELLARFDDAPTIQGVLRRFDLDASGAEKLPAATREAVVRAAGMHADRRRFDALLLQLQRAGGEEERWLFASALARGRDASRAAELLELALTKLLPPNVASAIPGMVARDSPFGELAYRYTRDHWPALAELAGQSGRARLLPGAAESFNDAELGARLLEDQRRAAGVQGDARAATVAARIALLAQIKQRESASLETLLARWRPND